MVEVQLRDKERNRQFDGDFIELARSVYKLNDECAWLKRELNARLGSSIVEEKTIIHIKAVADVPLSQKNSFWKIDYEYN